MGGEEAPTTSRTRGATRRSANKYPLRVPRIRCLLRITIMSNMMEKALPPKEVLTMAKVKTRSWRPSASQLSKPQHQRRAQRRRRRRRARTRTSRRSDTSWTRGRFSRISCSRRTFSKRRGCSTNSTKEATPSYREAKAPALPTTSKQRRTRLVQTLFLNRLAIFHSRKSLLMPTQLHRRRVGNLLLE